MAKETPFRYPFIARIDPKPEVTFTPVPQTICGEDDPYLILSVWGDKREEILIDEKFDSGLGAFVNVKVYLQILKIRQLILQIG